MTAIPRGGVLDPKALQAAIRQRTAALAASVDAQAFEGNGGLELWTSKTRSVATTAAAFSAGAMLDLNLQRNDSPAHRIEDISALASEDARARTELDRLVAGRAGLAEWFGRASRVGFAAATHAARASEFCDASTAPALAAAIDAGVNGAVNAATGRGDAQFWADRTAQAAAQVKNARLTALAEVARTAAAIPAGGPPSSPAANVAAGASAPAVSGAPSGVPIEPLMARLHALRERLFSNLETLAYNAAPADPTTAMEIAMQSGVVALEYGGRVSLEVAALRADHDAAPEEALETVAQQADRAIQCAASLGLEGSGFAAYWFERDARIAAAASRFAAAAASHCNGALAEALRPQFEALLSHTPRTVAGEAQSWMEQASATANAVIPAVQEIEVELRAAALATRNAPVPSPAAEDDAAAADRARLEAEKARQQARMQVWEETAQRRTHDQTLMQQEINALTARLKPLTETDGKLRQQIGRLNAAAIAGGAGALCGAALALTFPAYGIPLAVSGAAFFGGAMWSSRAPRAEQAKGAAEQAAVEKELVQRSVPLTTARLLSSAAFARRNDAEARMHAVDGRLAVHHMAEAVNHPHDANVRVDDETVRIGNVVVHRHRADRC